MQKVFPNKATYPRISWLIGWWVELEVLVSKRLMVVFASFLGAVRVNSIAPPVKKWRERLNKGSKSPHSHTRHRFYRHYFPKYY